MKENILLAFEAKDKWDAIDKIVAHLSRIQGVETTEKISEEVVAREKRISTGFEFGIAIPHVKTAMVSKTFFALAVSPSGIDFDSLDKKPTHIIVMILSPISAQEEHLKLMATITKKLSKESNRTAILEAKDVQTVVDVLEADND